MTRRLLVDVGNSRVKWALAAGAELEPAAGVADIGDALAALDTATLPGVDEVWVSDVLGGARRDALGATLQRRCNVDVRFAIVQKHHAGLRCVYEQPARLGVDRWLMLLAVWLQQGGPACVAAAGTALTFDAVDAQGQHQGGCIAPGLRAMQQAVLDSTAFESAAPAEAFSAGLGVDTESCVRQGALHAAAGLLDRLGAEHGAGAACLLAGGDAPRLLPHLRSHWRHRPALVLEGLLALALRDPGA